MGFWDELNKKLADYGSWLEEFRWPLKPPPAPAPPAPEPLEEEVEYDSTGRIISVPEGWEVEFTATVTGYSGGAENPLEEVRITLYGAPGEITEADLIEQFLIEAEGKLYYAGEEIAQIESFSERAVEI
jgi:hypothetical protein